MTRRVALAVALGAAVLAVLVLVFPPGRYDLAPGDMTGTMAHDEGYWSGPARELFGRVTFDRYDRERALCLALPQNLAGALAHTLGLSEDASANAGSYLAAFALGVLAAFVSWGGRAALLAMLLAPPVWGHLRGDLGEGPTIALVAWWAYCVSRGRFGWAAFLAVVGVLQKGCGLFLGVGTLAALFLPSPERAHAVRPYHRIARVAVGGAAAVVVLAVAAKVVFGDDPVGIFLRPFRVTDDFWVAPPLSSIAVQAAFPGYQLFGEYLVPLFVLAALTASPRKVGAAWVVALLAGLLYRGYFAANWRFVPVIPLLALPAIAPLSDAPTRSGRIVGAVAWVQAACGIVAWTGWAPGAVGLAIVSLITLPAILWLWPRVPPGFMPRTLAAAAVLAVVVPVARATARADEVFSTGAHQLADAVAARSQPGDLLMSHPIASLRLRGTFALVNMGKHWLGEALAFRGRVLRVWADDGSGAPYWKPVPSFRRLEPPEFLGRFPYAPSSWPRDLWLFVWVPDAGG